MRSGGEGSAGAMMDPLTEVMMSIAVASALGIGLNLVLIALQKRSPKHPLFNLLIDEGGGASQLWTFQVSMAFQGLVYTPAVLIAALQWRGTRADDLAGWEWKSGGLFPGPGEENRTGELLALRVYFYAFCGYLVRDMMMQLREQNKRYLMLLHHVVCIGGVLLGLATPTGGTAVALGTFALEVGSFFYNGWVIDNSMRDYTAWPAARCWPRGEGFVGRPFPILFLVVFTASNVVGGYLLAVAVWVNYEAGNTAYAVRRASKPNQNRNPCPREDACLPACLRCPLRVPHFLCSVLKLTAELRAAVWMSTCFLSGSVLHQRLAFAVNASETCRRVSARYQRPAGSGEGDSQDSVLR